MRNRDVWRTCSTSESSFETEIGLVKFSCCDKGVHSIHICEKEDVPSSTLNDGDTTAVGKFLSETLQWLKFYFAGRMMAKPPEICVWIMRSKGSSVNLFWMTMMQEVPVGHIASYKKLSEMNGDPRGFQRDIAAALWTNPVALIIPCHRIVKGGGVLGRYSGGGGARVKEWLQKHEKEGHVAWREELKKQSAEMDVLEKDLDARRAELDKLCAELDDGRGYRSGRMIRIKGRRKLIRARSMMREGRNLLLDPVS